MRRIRKWDYFGLDFKWLAENQLKTSVASSAKLAILSSSRSRKRSYIYDFAFALCFQSTRQLLISFRFISKTVTFKCCFKFPTFFFFFNLWINFGIHPAGWKIAKIIMLHKAGKPEELVGSYRPLSLTTCLGRRLEKAVADNLSNWAEAKKKFNKQQYGFRKNRSTNDNFFKIFRNS